MWPSEGHRRADRSNMSLKDACQHNLVQEWIQSKECDDPRGVLHSIREGLWRTCIPRRLSEPGPCPALPVKLPDRIWKMSKAYSSLYVSTFKVSWISHLHDILLLRAIG